MKRIIPLLLALLIPLSLWGCTAAKPSDVPSQESSSLSTFTSTSPETATTTTQATTLAPITQAEYTEPVATVPPSTEIVTQASSQEAQTEAITKKMSTTFPFSTQKELQKTGEMAFSDAPDNKYIQAVTQKYNVPAENLVALYTIPDNDGNIVLQFDGSRNEQGQLVRTTDTLIAIYSVNMALECRRASEDSSLNEYPYGEMKVMFISTTKHIMPEFEAELNG